MSRVRLQQWVSASLSISTVLSNLHGPGDTGTAAKSCNVLVQEPEHVERDTISRKRVPGKLEFEAWPEIRNFRIWRMNFRREVSSSASRPRGSCFSNSEWFQEDHQRSLQKKSLYSTRSCTKRKTYSHAKASRMDHRRIRFGPQ